MNREDLRFECPVPIDSIQHKKVHASFTRDGGASVETGIGEIMVSPNSAGESLAWIQFRDDVNQEYVRVYLNEERVRLLRQTDSEPFDFAIEGPLDAGLQLDE